MDATTNLKFELSSTPNPDPDPVVPVTPETPTNTTTPTSPNTGNNTAEGNVGGTIFGALFLVIGIASLIVFLAKYLKKNRRISFAERGSFHLSMRPRIFATVSLSLALAFLGGLMITKFTNVNPTNATSLQTVNVTAKSDITFTVKRGELQVISDTITVANQGHPYDLYMYTDNNSFCHTNNEACLTSVNGNIISDTNLAVMNTENKWGVSRISDNPEKAIWASVPVTNNTGAKIAHKTGNESTTTISYAVFAGTDLPDGTYTAKVSYHAVAEFPDEEIYNVQTVNGFVGETGEDDDEDFPAGAEVVIRHACGSNDNFVKWTVDYGDITIDDIEQEEGENLFYFTMPASNVHLTATCKETPPEPTSKWIIKYNKNISTANGTMANTESTTTTATLSANTFTLNNSTFQGWSCTAGQPWKTSLKNFNDKASVTEASLTAAGCNPDTSSGSNTYTIYALWKAKDPEWIQDVTAEYCDSLDFFEVKTLKDRRDSKSYDFAKYADGRCWMLQDLAFEPGTGSKSLESATTDVGSDKTVEFSTSDETKAAYHVQTGQYSSYSILYNFRAATAGTYNGSQSANDTIANSLCPTSWKLPDAQNQSAVYSNGQGELYGLHHYNIGEAYGGGSSKSTNWNRNTFLFSSNNISLSTGGTAKALNFKYSGAWKFGSSGDYAERDGGTKAVPGTYSSYLMSTVRENNMVSAMNPHSNDPSDTDLQNGETNPAEGSSVRCVLRTAKQRTTGNRSAPVKEADITDSYTSDEVRATYNQIN